MANRRIDPRVNVNWPVEIKIPGKLDAIEGKIKNISLKGSYLEVDFKMEIAQKFMLKISAQIGERVVPIITEATVVRRALLSQMRGYGYGVALIRVRVQDGPVLHRILGSGEAERTTETETYQANELDLYPEPGQARL